MRFLFLTAFALFLFLPITPSFLHGVEAAAQAETCGDSPKLDQVLKNQVEILRMLDDLKKELAIVKIRATR